MISGRLIPLIFMLIDSTTYRSCLKPHQVGTKHAKMDDLHAFDPDDGNSGLQVS
jgi:hypothetical protein